MDEKQLKEVIARTLGLELSEVTDKLERNKNEEWDSFNHLMLISEIEKAAGISFSTRQIEAIKNVDDLKKAVAQAEKS